MINGQFRESKKVVKEEVEVPEMAPFVPSEMTIDELEVLLDAKRKELGKGIKQTEEQVLPPGKAPTGFLWAYNRGPEKFEWQHNTIVYEIDGHSFGLFPVAIAEHGRRRSLLTLDPISGATTHQLALPDDTKTYGRPLLTVARPRGEVIDRSTSTDPAEFGSSEKTRVAVINIEGMTENTQARPGAFAELA